MKKIQVLLLLIVTSLSEITYGQDIELPVPSPWGQVSQKIGLTTVTVSYSRPSMKSRKIFGSLVPFDQVWRTGANQCTRIDFNTDITVGGQKIPAGTYALFTIPSQNQWTIILNKDAEQWGAYNYKQDLDVMRFTVTPQSSAPVESMTFTFTDVKPGTAMLELTWETTKIAFPINVDYMEQSQKNIQNALAEIDNAYSLYNDAAEFYLDNNLDAKQALQWAQSSVSVKEKYWNTYTLSRALAANGQYADAVAMAKKSLDLAKTANNIGVIDDNIKNIDEWQKNVK